MSKKIYKIEGKTQKGEDQEKFSGEIICDDDIFYGVAKDDVEETCFLAGSFAKNHKGNKGMAFFKIKNGHSHETEMYLIKNLLEPDICSWGAPSMLFSYFTPKGNAEIRLVGAEYSEERYETIKHQFDKIDRANILIEELLEQVPNCALVIKNAT